jgi:hypothetical protein
MTSTSDDVDDVPMIPLGELLDASRLGILHIEHSIETDTTDRAQDAIVAAEFALQETDKVLRVSAGLLDEAVKNAEGLITDAKELGVTELLEEATARVEVLRTARDRARRLVVESRENRMSFLRTVKKRWNR